ncbi:MAG: hypothetical protein ACXQS2_01500 [Methermicoccaceae archaeon]
MARVRSKPRDCENCIFSYYDDGQLTCVYGRAVVSIRPCKDFEPKTSVEVGCSMGEAKSLEEYKEELKGKHCKICGESLEDCDVHHYPHSGGWEVEGFRERQWLYVICPKCGYSWSWWKLKKLDKSVTT